MGNAGSIVGRGCLLSALGGDRALVAFRGDVSFRNLTAHEYNLNIPVTPVAITFPKTAGQVADIIKCAVEHDYKVQAVSGGHSYGNYGLGGIDGAVVVHLRNFQQFSMDETTHMATIGAGTPLGDVTEKLYRAGGRAMAHGVCPQVGVGGHFTIGGLGPTSRQWGSALDHVEEVEVVLANSSIVRASSTLNPDLFFAVKGAAASFGIVTAFKVRTQPAPGLAVQYLYSLSLGSTVERAKLFREWQRFVSDPSLSRKFSSVLTAIEHGIILSGIFYGSKAEYDQLGIEQRLPITEPGTVVVLTDWLGMLGHAVEELALGIGGDVSTYFYAKSTAITSDDLISERGIGELFYYLDNIQKGTLTWFISFDLQGGATNDFPANATAYAHRDVLYWVQSYGVNLLGPVSQTTVDFLNGINEIIRQSVAGSEVHAYPGYVDPLMPDAQKAYWGLNLPRLQKIKAIFDPSDVFHNPQSVNLVQV
ncbi:FAD-binding oxidoreductase [Aspergillus clavatus NRRL 1]|uniref:Glucooligosaccharide oxidase, putative n=1 Tax=Aspergillus clavatus (strain ATCC 1007 / CBS 513.65 / DSM 816 / NCTC 3887 / NRRL 1 / QM 1276 / 107) TaxID=344612 RepID=A1CHD8_ASPCL|nr:glucooligosaccharide oxidase, putative [Aspergillus clavatus NRRL 1]EAW10293.1 glucooligosaccharide oxidase, putative [Aspergillus clavatus NRRL 1]